MLWMHSISALILMSYGGICSVGFNTEASSAFHQHTVTDHNCIGWALRPTVAVFISYFNPLNSRVQRSQAADGHTHFYHPHMTIHMFRMCVRGLRENPQDKSWSLFKKCFFTNITDILESLEDNIVWEKPEQQSMSQRVIHKTQTQV